MSIKKEGRAEIALRTEGDLVWFGESGKSIPVPLNLALAEFDRRNKLADIEATVNAQLRMPLLKLKKLIQFDRRTAPKDEIIKVVRQGIEIERIPAERWYIIIGRDGRVRAAPDSHGRFLKAQVDPKILTGTEEFFDHFPSEAEPFVTARVVLHYYAGNASYTGTQTKFVPWTADAVEKSNISNKTMTQARGKAARAASPSTYPDIAEEVLDFETPVVYARGPRVVEVIKPVEIKNLGNLFSAIYSAKLIDPDDPTAPLFQRKEKIAEIVGVTRLEEIGQPGKPSYSETWEAICKACKYKPETIEETEE